MRQPLPRFRGHYTASIPAQELEVGDYAVEDRRQPWGMERVAIRVTEVSSSSRHTSYRLDDGSVRQLGLTVQVEIMGREG